MESLAAFSLFSAIGHRSCLFRFRIRIVLFPPRAPPPLTATVLRQSPRHSAMEGCHVGYFVRGIQILGSVSRHSGPPRDASIEVGVKPVQLASVTSTSVCWTGALATAWQP